ncbi:MAG TPA: SufD family Fe-S cluster assembly protein [Patescibacteria group bacterium]
METRKIFINEPGNYDFKLLLDSINKEEELRIILKANREGVYNLNILSDHLVEKTFGRVEVRGIAQNGAKVSIIGRVKVEKEAPMTDSFLSMKMLILDGKSSAIAEPELEILNNNVKASHSASVGKIDEEQLLYLMSRGMDNKSAKNLIVSGFLEEVIK